MNNFSEEQLREARLAEYKEVAQNFRTLTEIRFKLLSFLPIGTALITLSTAWSKGETSVPLSLFGLAVTLALIVYNERNNQLYDELVQRAAQLERLLGLPDGNFSQRPAPWLKIRPIPETSDGDFAVPIEHGWPIGIIYRASIIAWLFMLFSPIFGWLGVKILSDAGFDVSLAGPVSTLFTVVTAFAVGQSFFSWFEVQKRDRRKSMRTLAKEGVIGLAALKFPPERADLDEWSKLFSRAAHLRGGEPEKEFNTILRLAGFYLSKDLMQSVSNMYYRLPPLKSSCVFGQETAADVIALFTDLPARWLLDVYSGRRGSEESEEDRDRPIQRRVGEWIQAIES